MSLLIKIETSSDVWEEYYMDNTTAYAIRDICIANNINIGDEE